MKPVNKVVFLLMGTALSGKSHFADTQRKWCVISADDIKKELYGGEWLWYANHGTFTELLKQFRKALYSPAEHTKRIYLDHQFITLSSRKQIYNIIQKAYWSNNIRAKVIILFFDTPLTVCLERNKLRPIPLQEKTIKRQYNKISWPIEKHNAEYPFFVKTLDICMYPDFKQWHHDQIHKHYSNCYSEIETIIEEGLEDAILDNRSDTAKPDMGSTRSNDPNRPDYYTLLVATIGTIKEENRRSLELLEEPRQKTPGSTWRRVDRQVMHILKRGKALITRK